MDFRPWGPQINIQVWALLDHGRKHAAPGNNFRDRLHHELLDRGWDTASVLFRADDQGAAWPEILLVRSFIVAGLKIEIFI
jgi:hypothetical protein